MNHAKFHKISNLLFYFIEIYMNFALSTDLHKKRAMIRPECKN
jgi:hypothetical protein